MQTVTNPSVELVLLEVSGTRDKKSLTLLDSADGRSVDNNEQKPSYLSLFSGEGSKHRSRDHGGVLHGRAQP